MLGGGGPVARGGGGGGAFFLNKPMVEALREGASRKKVWPTRRNSVTTEGDT